MIDSTADHGGQIDDAGRLVDCRCLNRRNFVLTELPPWPRHKPN
jgi:hypothetical protein